MIAGFEGGSIIFWRSLIKPKKFLSHKQKVTCVVVSNDSKLISGSKLSLNFLGEDECIVVWDLETC